MAFGKAKGRKRQRKRPSFAARKTAFYKLPDYQLVANHFQVISQKYPKRRRHTKLPPFGRAGVGIQSAAFCVAIDGLSPCKRRPFAVHPQFICMGINIHPYVHSSYLWLHPTIILVVGNSHCLNSDFQFRAPTRNPVYATCTVCWLGCFLDAASECGMTFTDRLD